MDLIRSMEDNIKELGHTKVWNIIDRFSNPETRIAYRNLFFKSGGRI